MPRTLPWLSQPSPAHRLQPAQLRTSSGRTPKRKPHVLKANHSNITVLNSSKAEQSHDDATNSTPSSLPPPASQQEEPMMPSDSIWLMVEDELYQVAQQFTKHLHHAEYKRLQEQAAQRNEQTAMSRPVGGRPHIGVDGQMKRKIEAERIGIHKPTRQDIANVSQYGNGASGHESDELESDEEIIGDRHLAGLMRGTGGAPLTRRIMLSSDNTVSSTRAAAGFARQSFTTGTHPDARSYDIQVASITGRMSKEADEHKAEKVLSDSETDEADLDTQTVKRTQLSSRSMAQSSLKSLVASTGQAQGQDGRSHCDADSRHPSEVSHRNKPIPSEKRARISSTVSQYGPPADDYARTRSQPPALLSRSKLKRTAQEEHPKNATIKLEEIPTFLF